MENYKIKYEVAEPGYVTIKVVDIIGNPVRYIMNKHIEAGSYELCMLNEKFSPGKYYYKVVYTGSNVFKGEGKQSELTIAAGQFKIEN